MKEKQQWREIYECCSAGLSYQRIYSSISEEKSEPKRKATMPPEQSNPGPGLLCTLKEKENIIENRKKDVTLSSDVEC